MREVEVMNQSAFTWSVVIAGALAAWAVAFLITMLGAGIGLLAAEALPDTQRKAIGWSGRRAAYLSGVAFMVVLLNFVLFRIMPGSPDRAIRNPNLTPEQVANHQREAHKE